MSLPARRNSWTTKPVERLGIPAIKMSDGPNWRGGEGLVGVKAAACPVGNALAAAWDTDLVREVGAALERRRDVLAHRRFLRRGNPRPGGIRPHENL